MRRHLLLSSGPTKARKPPARRDQMQGSPPGSDCTKIRQPRGARRTLAVSARGLESEFPRNLRGFRRARDDLRSNGTCLAPPDSQRVANASGVRDEASGFPEIDLG